MAAKKKMKMKKESHSAEGIHHVTLKIEDFGFGKEIYAQSEESEQDAYRKARGMAKEFADAEELELEEE